MEGVCEKRLGLRLERVNWDRAVAEPFTKDRSLVYVQNREWIKVDEKEPCRDHDRTEYEPMFKYHDEFTSTTEAVKSFVY